MTRSLNKLNVLKMIIKIWKKTCWRYW